MPLETLTHYRLLERVGTGALGDVYRARDTKLGRTVLVHVLPGAIADDPDVRERFLEDAHRAATLSHPNIAAVYEVGEDQGHLFLACEFVVGDSLRAVVGGHAMNARRAVDLAAQLADALAEGHAAGIVHGAVTPEHILVTPRGTTKLVDFGLTAWTHPDSDRSTTATAADDIAALGGVLFELITARPPAGSVATPSRVNRSLPREVDDIVVKAMTTRRDRGYQAAATMAAELRSLGAILDTRSEAAVPSGAKAAPVRASGPRARAWLLLALVILAAAGWFGRAPLQRIWASTFAPPPEPRIAVLPLQLDSADATQLFFADGFAEDLARRLSRVPGVTVLGRSGIRRDRGRSPEDLAGELGAVVVLAGQVRPQSNPLVLSLRLVDASDGAELWSEEYTREPAGVFALQADAADDVAHALKLEVAPTAARARVAARQVDPAAYRAYLEGRQAASSGALEEAIGDFQRAADLDAGLSEALAALALTIDATGAGGTEPASGHLGEAARLAYQLDPDLPEANAAMAVSTRELPQALQYLRHGVEVDRSWSDGYRRIGDLIRNVDPERATAFYHASLEIDPRQEASRTALAEVESAPAPAAASADREAVRAVLDGLLD